MKKQVQSYLEHPEYDKILAMANKKGLSFAAMVRVILLEYLEKQEKQK